MVNFEPQQQFKGACLETRRTRADMSHYPPNDAENDQKTWEPTTHE